MILASGLVLLLKIFQFPKSNEESDLDSDSDPDLDLDFAIVTIALIFFVVGLVLLMSK